MSAAQSHIVVDDADVRVTTWSFTDDGDSTGVHRHEFDYVLVPVTGGTFSVVAPDGSTSEMTQLAGQPYRRTAGVTHEVVRRGGADGATVVFVEVELKAHPLGG